MSDTPLTPKEEAFARFVVSGMSATDAYKAAYDVAPDRANIRQDAYAVAQRPRVIDRVELLRNELAAKQREAIVFELQEAMELCKEAYVMARENQRPNDMISAVKLMAHMNGLLVAQRENDRSPVAGMSRDETKAALETLAALRKAMTA